MNMHVTSKAPSMKPKIHVPTTNLTPKNMTEPRIHLYTAPTILQK